MVLLILDIGDRRIRYPLGFLIIDQDVRYANKQNQDINLAFTICDKILANFSVTKKIRLISQANSNSFFRGMQIEKNKCRYRKFQKSPS